MLRKRNEILLQFLCIQLLILFFLPSCNAQSNNTEKAEKIKSNDPEEEEFYGRISDSIKANPQNLEWRYIRAIGYQEKAQYPAAIGDLNMLMDHFKKDPAPLIFSMLHNDTIAMCDILYTRAYSYDKADSVDQSVRDYRELLKCNPSDFFYQIAIPRVLIHHKRFEEAEKEIEEMIKKEPNNERAWVYQGVLKYEMGLYKEALMQLNLTLSKFPNSIEALVTKAKIQFKLSENNTACKTLEEAKSKINLAYFGGQRGYERSFNEEIDSLKTANCR